MIERRILPSVASVAWAVRVIVAPVALLALWSMRSASAEASCGDYVMLGHGNSHGMHPGAVHPTGAPCRGPECHRRQPSPLPPDLPVKIASVDAWTGLGLPAGNVIRPAVLLELAALRFPPAMAARIDRPPKAAL